jgi:hypothetical protein
VADLTEGPVPRPLTLELVVHLADRGTRGGWLPYMQLLFALEVATGRSREVCVSAIMGAVLSGYLDVEKVGYLDVEKVDQMLAIGRVRITAAGRSLVPKPEPAVTGFPRPDDRLAGLDPILSAMADGFVRAVSLAVAAELRLWSAACRRMVERAREGQEFPDDDLSPLDRGRVAVYEGMVAHLDRRAARLADAASIDEKSRVTEFLESIRPSTGAGNRRTQVRVTGVPGSAAIEVASYLASLIGMSPGREEDLRVAFQRMIDEGRIVGRVLVGDHDEDGTTVQDWTEVGSR